ncbi:MAG: two-component system sensor histidine kinase CreC [Chromatiales bacterium]|jgi:two-component system sensor histidine kinase CreC
MNIRTRIFLFFIVLMAVGIFSLVRWMQGEMRPRYMEAQEDTLVDTAQLLASLVSRNGIDSSGGKARIKTDFLQQSFDHLLHQQLSATIYQMHKTQVDIRVYVTDGSGKVVFDSDSGRDLGADYSQWRDVHLTLKGNYGARSTEFDPLFPDGSTMYIAAPIRYQGDIVGVLSVGKPTRNAERFMTHLLGNISYVGMLILLIASIIGLFIHWWLSRPLQQLQNYATAVSNGERTALPKHGNNEVGRVGRAMESMRIALDGKTYITDYVQALTHELKSPIAAIRGAAELLQEDMPAADRERFLANIRNEVARMQQLIERLLELAALESRPSLNQRRHIDLRELLEDVVESFRPIALQHQVTIELQLSGNPRLQGDEFLLSKAITNLLKNAIEFSPPSSSVQLSCKTVGNGIEIAVSDHGSGIPAYAQQRVFERFFALPKTDGRKGSGLGLSFVKEIAALHQAQVKIESSEEKGSTVSLLFANG